MGCATLTVHMRKRAHVVLFLIILLLGAALRLYRLEDESLWHDEIVSYRNLGAPSLIAFLQAERRLDPPMAPLYFAVEYYWAKLAGDSVYAVRLLSVLLGLATFPLLYAFTARLWGRRAALAASLYLALAHPHILYSQEIRMYALTGLLALASMYTLLRAWQAAPPDGSGTMRGSRQSTFWLAAHVAVNALLLATHLMAVLVVLVQGSVILVRLFRRRAVDVSWVGAHAALALPYLWWFSNVDMAALGLASGWMKRPGWEDLAFGYFSYLPGIPLWRHSPMLVLCAAVAVVAVFLCGTRERSHALLRPGEETAPVSSTGLLIAWYWMPLAALFVLSFLSRPCFVPRYVFHSGFALYPLAGAAFTSPKSRLRAAVLALAPAVVFAVYWAGIPRPLRPDLDSAGTLLRARDPLAPVIVYRKHTALALDYLGQPPPLAMAVADTLPELEERIAVAANTNDPFWLVILADAYRSRGHVECHMRSLGLEFRSHDFPGCQPIRVYRASRLPDNPSAAR